MGAGARDTEERGFGPGEASAHSPVPAQRPPPGSARGGGSWVWTDPLIAPASRGKLHPGLLRTECGCPLRGLFFHWGLFPLLRQGLGLREEDPKNKPADTQG